jgi:hypothetical protein
MNQEPSARTSLAVAADGDDGRRSTQSYRFFEKIEKVEERLRRRD